MTTENLAEIVERIFRACLWTAEEVKAIGEAECIAQSKTAEGILTMAGFHPSRLSQHAEEIKAAIRRMNSGFFADGGGGWSFLNLCVDRNGDQWGEHSNCDQLVQLAIASGMGKYNMPREMWSILPGGMPYVVFTIAQTEVVQ